MDTVTPSVLGISFRLQLASQAILERTNDWQPSQWVVDVDKFIIRTTDE